MGGGTGTTRGMHVNLYISSARANAMHKPITHVGVFSIIMQGIFFFCVRNSISSRQYLPWPPPAEHGALQ